MGSYGDAWLQCHLCRGWGQCLSDEHLAPFAIGLNDVDGAGLLCDRCYEPEEFPTEKENIQKVKDAIPTKKDMCF